MKWAVTGAALAAVVLAGWVIGVAAQEPDAPAKKEAAAKVGEKWEYCEVQFRAATSRAAKGDRGGFGAGGKGGAGGGGGAPGGPGGGGPFPVKAPTPSITWVSGEDETKATNWEDLATKMKLAAPKKDLSESAHRMRVLNHLGSQGWELVSHHGSDTTGLSSASGGVYTFKRKVAK